MIRDRQMMVTIVWNPQGFHVVDALPKAEKFNASFYIDIIPQRVLESCSTGPGPGLIIHAHNARPHTAQKTLTFCRENNLEMAPHRPYSSGLAPPGFFFCGHVKHAFEGAEFPSEEDRLAAIHLVLSNRRGDTLRLVFAKFVKRLNWVALNERHYYR
jgi:hypothetical protein